MAKFSIDSIKLKYGVKTFEETKKTYDWIEKAAKKWGGPQVKIKSEFLFNIGNITCKPRGIQEFIEMAYGATNYVLHSFDVYIYIKDKRVALHWMSKLFIHADNKVDLANFSSILEETSLEEKSETALITYIESQTNIENQHNETIVQGDNNTVVNNSSEVNVNTSKEESKFKKFLIAIGQNLLSNCIWYLLTIGITALITYFVTKG